jgi:putative ABC transport system permease protein
VNRVHPLLKQLAILVGLPNLALKRLRYHPGLTLLSLLGIIFAVGLVTSAAFFAQAVDQVILSQELAEYSRITKRPPFSTRVYTFSSAQVPLSLERTETLAGDVADTLSTEVGLPIKHLGLQVDSGAVALHARPGTEQYQEERPIGNVHLIYIRDIQDHINLAEGRPLDDGVSAETLEVWMHANLAEEMGVQTGDLFELRVGQQPQPMPVRITGLWQPIDPADPFWFSDPNQALRDALLVRRQDYLAHLEPWLPVKVRAVSWYIVLDENEVIPAEARQYISGFQRGETIISKYLPDARLTAPSVSLEKFVQRQDTLTILLLGFNVPAFGFLLYFLILSSAIVAYWQRREVAVLISRGVSTLSILYFTLVEELILFIIGCPLGLGFGLVLARLMGYTDSFLSFSPRPPLPVSLLGINIPLTLITLGVVLIARLWPAAQAAGQTVVKQEREHSRPPSGPFWYRNFLDLLLIIPAVYAYDQLSSRGTLALLVRDRPEDLYRDPLLILVPALFILTMALLIMRLFPLIMRLIDWGAGLMPWLIPHLALRQLGRQHHNYINPLLLVIVSLALGVYTLSLAASLDQWLIDRIYYRVGADLAFEPYSEVEALAEEVGASWIPPIGEFSTLPGAEAAARVGDYLTEITLPRSQGGKIEARFLAVDRVDFSKVAWFRDDLAAESLGGLMNRLALVPDGILVSQQFLAAHSLQVGDQIQMRVITDFGTALESSFTVVGAYRHFPTVYEDKLTVIGNLEYLFSFFGLAMPHHIWLRLQPNTDGQSVLQAVPSTGIEAIREKDTRRLITEAKAEMERVGVFGTLSISFLAAAVMAAVGLLTYSYASLHERLYYFAVLRAVGVKRFQVIGQVFMEYAILTTYGATAGVFCGAVVTEFFVPLFRVTGEQGIPLPPMLPIIAYTEIVPLAAAFAGIMILLELGVIALALYRRLFGMLRMGHQG